MAKTLAAAGIVKPLLMLGLTDKFIHHGDPVELLSSVGLDAAGTTASIRQRFDNAGAADDEPRLVVNNV